MEEKNVLEEENKTLVQEISHSEGHEEIKTPRSRIKKLLVFLVVIMAFFVPFKMYAHFLAGQEYVQKQEIVNSSQPNSKKMLVVYQPSGKSTYVEELAQNIAQGASEQGTNVTIIRPNRMTKITLSDYDIFVFGTPWYMEPSPGLLSFIKDMGDFSDKKVYLFISQGGNYPAPWRFNSLKTAIKGTDISGQMQFIHYFYWKRAIPGELEKAKNWGKDISKQNNLP